MSRPSAPRTASTSRAAFAVVSEPRNSGSASTQSRLAAAMASAYAARLPSSRVSGSSGRAQSTAVD
ncbi:hypothetical protein [Prescottella equi]|uniref:hypothetical protein n=1 Tax=Rhodococcus hoagii TaxID=43767 RepID=UPI001E577162|nr:hypothetical protein [Prescottella equi]